MPLAYNGGPNMTHAIPHTSPAFNAGTSCSQQTDQRYVARDAKCDVGAFEFSDFTRATITIDQSTKVNATTGKALLTGTIQCTRNDAFRLALEKIRIRRSTARSWTSTRPVTFQSRARRRPSRARAWD